MFTDKEKAQCALWFESNILCAQYKSKNEFRRQPPHVNNIPRSLKQSKKQAVFVRESHTEDLP